MDRKSVFPQLAVSTKKQQGSTPTDAHISIPQDSIEDTIYLHIKAKEKEVPVEESGAISGYYPIE